MINRDKLINYIKEYKSVFTERFNGGECFKWESIKCFQDNWDINADDFGEMFKRATARAGSLLATGQAFPRKMILLFAENDEASARQMFNVLFDETKELTERVAFFIEEAKRLMTALPALSSGSDWK